MKLTTLALAALSLTPLPALAQAPPCAPPWTSWEAPLLACATGRICEDFMGHQIEVLHVNADTRQAYIRDRGKRYCQGRPVAPADVAWMTRKDLRRADCLMPTWMLQEVFAAYDPSCHEHSVVLVVKGGVLSVATGK